MCWVGDSKVGGSAKAVAEAENAERAAKDGQVEITSCDVRQLIRMLPAGITVRKMVGWS